MLAYTCSSVTMTGVEARSQSPVKSPVPAKNERRNLFAGTSPTSRVTRVVEEKKGSMDDIERSAQSRGASRIQARGFDHKTHIGVHFSLIKYLLSFDLAPFDETVRLEQCP